jgi:hypothetical protein
MRALFAKAALVFATGDGASQPIGPKPRELLMSVHSRQRSFLWVLVTIASLAVVTFPRSAQAQESNSAAAQSLFDEARTLMHKGRYAEACPKFEESQRLDPGAGTLLNLAVCYEKTGRTASAWTMYLEAGTAARAAGNADRAKLAKERAAALATRLPRITIHVTKQRDDGMEVQRDGSSVRGAQLGTAIPADPGPHTVSATAPGRKAWQTTIMLRDGAQETVVVPELESAAPGEAQATKRPTPTRLVDQDKAPARAPTSTSSAATTQRVFAIIAATVGTAGVAGGTVFGLRSLSARNEAQKTCDGPACTSAEGVEFRSEAITNGNMSTAAFIIGGVGLAAGAVLWLTAPDGSTQVGVGPGSVQVGARW